MKFSKKYPLALIILMSILDFNCSHSTYQSHEQNSFYNKTSIQISLESTIDLQTSIKQVIVELKNRSRSFNYFGVTDSNGSVIFKDIVDDNYDLFISGILNQNVSIKKNMNLKISVKI